MVCYRNGRRLLLVLVGLASVVCALNSITPGRFEEAPRLKFHRQGIGTWNKSDVDGRWLKSRSIVLTFDDGPSANYTPRILDILHKHQAPAIFFEVGKNIEKLGDEAPLLMKSILDAGHAVGSHGYDHSRLRSTEEQSDAEVLASVIRAEQSFDFGLGARTYFFRAPYGQIDERSHRLLLEREYMLVGWSLDSSDWQATSPADVIHEVNVRMELAKYEGGVLLLHEREVTVEALDGLLTDLTRQGFRFVSIYDALPPEYLDRLWKTHHCGVHADVATVAQAVRNRTFSAVCAAMRSAVLRKHVDGRVMADESGVQTTVLKGFYATS